MRKRPPQAPPRLASRWEGLRIHRPRECGVGSRVDGAGRSPGGYRKIWESSSFDGFLLLVFKLILKLILKTPKFSDLEDSGVRDSFRFLRGHRQRRGVEDDSIVCDDYVKHGA